MPNSILMLEGGHTIFLRGQSVTDAEHYITERTNDALQSFAYFQPENYPDNGIAVDPKKVVAIVDGGER